MLLSLTASVLARGQATLPGQWTKPQDCRMMRAMCGRFALTLPDDAMAQLFDASLGATLMPTPRYNICPTQRITTIVAPEGERHLIPMRWGFLPHWYKTDRDGPLLINARAETIADKPAFRAACRTRRCLIPISGFYEWTKDANGHRLPWYISPSTGDVAALGGIWQDWTAPDGTQTATCAIVTTRANQALSTIHHRMPVTIEPADFSLWLGQAGKGAATLMVSAPENAYSFHRVDPRVNSNRPDDPDLILPWSE